MAEWYYIMIFTVCSVYISAWLGVEMLADNTKYKISHIQMFSIPLICILAIFYLGCHNKHITRVPFTSKWSKNKYVHYSIFISNRELVLREYLGHRGKLLLCLRSFNEVNRSRKHSLSSFDFHTVIRVFECMEKSLIMQSKPRHIAKQAYNFTISVDGLSFSGIDSSAFFHPSEKPVVPVVEIPQKSYEVNWNYAR